MPTDQNPGQNSESPPMSADDALTEAIVAVEADDDDGDDLVGQLIAVGRTRRAALKAAAANVDSTPLVVRGM